VSQSYHAIPIDLEVDKAGQENAKRFVEMTGESPSGGKTRSLAQRYYDAVLACSRLKQIAYEARREGRTSECLSYIQDARLERERAWMEFQAHITSRGEFHSGGNYRLPRIKGSGLRERGMARIGVRQA
jgi:hypothetical protein